MRPANTSEGRSIWRTALSLAVFVACAFATAASIPRRDVGPMGEKLRAFFSSEYEVAFVGCSWTEVHIDPTVFDERTRELGTPLKSFNLGLMGALQGEIGVILDRLSERPGTLRYVFIDVMPWSPVVYGPNRVSARERQWRTLRNTTIAIQKSTTAPEGAIAQLQLIGHNSFLSILRFLQVGSVIEGRGEDTARGFHPLEKSVDPEVYREYLEKYLDGGGQSKLWEVPDLDELRRSIGRLEAAGITPIFVVHPSTTNVQYQQFARDLAKSGDIRHLLDFGRPDEYPTLFAVEHRADYNHLNKKGSSIFSRLLAEEFIHEISPRS